MIGVFTFMLSLRRLLAVALCACVTWTVPGLAQPPPAMAPGSRVLVLPFALAVGPNAPESAGLWLGEAAAILVTDELARQGVGALPRDVRVAAFDRLHLPMAATLTRATMIRVGEIIGASEVVYGEVVLDEHLAVRARTIQLASGSQLPEVTETGELTGLFEVFRRVAAGIGVDGRPGGTFPLPSDPPLEAFENYVKGLVASTPASRQRFLELALADAPHDPRVLTALWEVHAANGDHEQALAAVSAVSDGLPDTRRARYLMALSLFELQRIEGAAATLRTLDADGSSPAVTNALGVVALRQETPDAVTAAAAFARAAAAEPGNADYLFNRGYAHALAGEWEAALTWLRESVRYAPANGDAHLVMAAVLGGAGRAPEAAREWELARLLGAGSEGDETPPSAVPTGLERLAPSLTPAAEAEAEAAIEEPAQREQEAAAVFHLEQGRRLIDAGRDREAVGELRRAIYLSPYADAPHLLLGGVYRRSGRLADAIDEFTVAIWSRESVEARLALGEALLEFGDRDGAREQATRALALAPGSADARDLLVRAGGHVVPSTTGPWPNPPTGKSN